MDFAEALRALMAERGVSGNSLARRAFCDKALISRLANGRQRPSTNMARLLDDALEAGGKLTALMETPLLTTEIGPEGRDRLAWAVKHPQRIDGVAVESLSAVLAAQRRAEDSLGSGEVLRPVLAQVKAIGDLVTESRGPIRPALVHVAGQWAQFAGWLHTNTGRPAQGDASLSKALLWAVEAGEPDLISEVLSFQGHAAWVAGQPGPAAGLSRAARRDPGVFPGQLAISAAQEAKALAMMGDGGGTDRLLDAADEQATAAAERPEDSPPWLYYHSPGFFALQRGLAYSYLAGQPLYRARAIAALEAGHAELPEGEQQSEWAAEYLCYLADLHALGGDVEQAAVSAMKAATVAHRARSVRLLRMLAQVRARLTVRWPAGRAVTALGEAIR
jgi:transcriptional regulator with XRE-family HTH domain